MSILSGRHVTLRPVELEDAGELLRILNHTSLVGCRNVPDEYPGELPLSAPDLSDIVKKWIENRKEDPHYVVVQSGSGEVVGHANMGWSWDTMTPWTSVVIDPECWRRRYGSEALQMMLRFLFRSTPANAASDWIAEWNEGALAFAAAQGFQNTGKVRHAGLRDGRPYDIITMDLLRTEWQARFGEIEHAS